MIDDKEYFKKKINKKNKEDDNKPLHKFLFSLLVKSLLVVIIFLGSLIYIRQSSKNRNNFKKVVYQNSISFARIYNAYEKYLGDVIPFKNLYKDNVKKVSDEKITYESIKKEDNGYVLNVSSNYTVPIINSGIIIEVKEDKKYGNLVKVQDKDGLNITYGYVTDLNVKLYDYVDKGEILGVSNEKLYLEFQEGDKYLSYEKYL